MITSAIGLLNIEHYNYNEREPSTCKKETFCNNMLTPGFILPIIYGTYFDCPYAHPFNPCGVEF